MGLIDEIITANTLAYEAVPPYSVYTLGNGMIVVVTEKGYETFDTFRAAKGYIDKLFATRKKKCRCA